MTVYRGFIWRNEKLYITWVFAFQAMVKSGEGKAISMNPRERVKQGILDKFRAINAREGHTLPARWIRLQFYPSLDPKEQDEFEAAVQELTADGLAEERPDSLALTTKGVDAIY